MLMEKNTVPTNCQNDNSSVLAFIFLLFFLFYTETGVLGNPAYNRYMCSLARTLTAESNTRGLLTA